MTNLLARRGSRWLTLLGVLICACKPSSVTHTGSATSAAAALPPPVGESLFDTVFVRGAGYTGGKALGPNPLADLLATLGKYGEVSYALIPFGRSLQRAKTDFAEPRVVLAYGNKAPTAPFLTAGRLFIGYATRAKQLEVIAYNEKAGRFEFQIVENFVAGGTPRVRYENRSLCMGCHQGGGPVFPVDNWSETSATGRFAATSTVVKDGIAAAQRQKAGAGAGEPTYLGLSLEHRFETYPAMGATLAHSAELIDEAVSVGESLLIADGIWAGCAAAADAKACRQDLVKQTLTEFAPPPALAALLKDVVASNGLRDNRLPDRAPDKTGQFPAVAGDLDPQTPRPLDSGLFMHWTLYGLGTRAKPPTSDPGAVLAGLPLDAKAPPWGQLYGAFEKAAKGTTALPLPTAAIVAPQPAAAPIAAGPGKQLDEKSVSDPGLKLLLHFCSECHGQVGDEGRLAFLVAKSEAQLLAQVQAKLPEIQRRLNLPRGARDGMPMEGGVRTEEFWGTAGGVTHEQRVKTILGIKAAAKK